MLFKFIIFIYKIKIVKKHLFEFINKMILFNYNCIMVEFGIFDHMSKKI